MQKFLAVLVIALFFVKTLPAQATDQVADQTANQAATAPTTNPTPVKKPVARTKSKSKKKLVKVIPDKPTVGDQEGLQYTQDPLDLKSNAALVIDQENSQVLFEKNAGVALPIASITKLMTSLVVMEANQDMDELLEVTTQDIDTEKGSSSRLKIGAKLTRSDMLHIALMSSENRAASALGRNYPGGLQACVAAMNAKARELGMMDTHYVDSTGLSSQNMASAQDLARLVSAVYASQPLIRQYSTDTKYAVHPGGRALEYVSSNRLTSSSDWEIGLQKTGYISEAGRCLVMEAMIEGRAIVMVFLDSKGKYSRFADAGRIRKWLETLKPQPTATMAAQ
jgi:serine-type D-Ala-D-Ala endopeptidase (penicillin-binding protein 7)